MNKYEKIMNHIEVTEEMQSRILNNTMNAPVSSPRKKISKYFKASHIAAGVAILLLGVSAFNSLNPSPTVVSFDRQILDQQSILSIEELSNKIGFSINHIKTLEEKADNIYYLISGKNTAQIEYNIGDNSYIYTISKEFTDEKIDNSIVENIDGIDVILAQNENLFFLASFKKENTLYEIYVYPSIEKSEILDLIKDILK